MRIAVAVCGVVASAACARAEASATAEAPITDPDLIWQLSPEQKAVAHPIHIEGRVAHVDPEWKLLWIQLHPAAGFMRLADDPPPMRDGQRVVLDGLFEPNRGLSAAKVRVTVLKEFEPAETIPVNGRINDLAALNARMVAADAYVDGQQYVSPTHVRLNLIVDNRPVVGWVTPRDPRAIPDWTGKFARVQGLYSSKLDPTSTTASVELWIGQERNLTISGTLADSPRFAVAPTPVNQISGVPPGTDVLVRGTVARRGADDFVAVQDGTGQIVVESFQHERLPTGTDIEAVGKVRIEGRRWVLGEALYRQVSSGSRDTATPSAARVLDTIDQIRQLSLDEARHGLPVTITGTVTWSHAQQDFFYLQDGSGGIRVRFDPATTVGPLIDTFLRVEGVTYETGSVAAVTLQKATQLGAMVAPEPRQVTFEQAMTGKEDGQWVEMRGFLQRTVSEGNWRSVYVTTPGGEFVGQVDSPVDFIANPGSLIRVHGVCAAVPDQAGQLNGVMLHVPFIHSITIEEDAPVDYFDLPVHSIKGLRQLTGARDLTRVRVIGTVVRVRPGHLVYLQDGDTGLPVLTHDNLPLLPGDIAEVVGILGWEGARVVLREAVYRRVRAGPPPDAVRINDIAQLQPNLDARLVTVRGMLIDISRQRDHTRYTLQTGNTVFDATLEHSPDASGVPDPAVGAGLELTGIYQLAFDDARQTRAFALQLDSPADIVVYAPPRLWTLRRALIACVVLAGAILLGAAWISALRRRVRQQTRQLREQLERQAKLEADLQHAARLESLGALAGGIAHDFNNLLTIILGNLGLALLDTRISDTTIRCLHEIERGTSRARTLTRQLLTFAKGGDPVRAPVQLAELVPAAADRVLHGTKVRCAFTTGPDAWLANVDKEQIAQVVQNLAQNAVQAMPAGGEVQIALRNAVVEADATHALAAGRYLTLRIADSGEGIAPDLLPRIFDPYVGMRKAGGGLGLATVYSIVKRHDGKIDVESTLGHGTVFTLWLPAASAPVTAAAPAVSVPAAEKPARERVKVLVMDDEASIQTVIAEALGLRGLAVTVVAEGGSALREFSVALHGPQPFDLLILDLTIPGGMGGREVLQLIRKLDAHVPAIVSSGYSSDPVMANFAQHGFQGMVQKPYELDELVAVVERLLGRSRTSGA